MSISSNKTQGKLCSLLSANSPHQKTVLEIEKALSIDASFPAEKNLVTELIKLLEQLNYSAKQDQWLAALLEIKATGEVKKWSDIAGSVRGGNALGGRFKLYPLPAFIIQPADSFITKQATGLKLVFLNALLQKPFEHRLTATANLLRNAITPGSKKLKSIKLLPELVDTDFAAYIKTLTNNKNQDVLIFIKNESELKSSIARLLNFIPKQQTKLIQVVPKAVIQTPPLHLPRFLGGGDIGIEGQPSKGQLVIHKIPNPEDITGEPPDFINLFTLEDDLDDLDDLDDEITPESEVEQQAEESRYWLTRHVKVVPTDFGRFTETERIKLVQFIHDNINSEDHVVAGLIGCMLVTGLPLDSLLQSTLGNELTFSKGGMYRRKIRLPRDAFSPTETQLHYFEDRADEITLKLPEPLASWMDNLCTANTANTLSQRLNIDLESAKTVIYPALKILRDRGRYQRIHAERIPAALAIEVSLMFRDPVITFLLASTLNQSAPKLSYYVTHSTEDLKGFYEQVTNKMVSL